jgi:hypothetical protein
MPSRQKLSRAAQSVNREGGTETVIGVESGELLGSQTVTHSLDTSAQ